MARVVRVPYKEPEFEQVDWRNLAAWCAAAEIVGGATTGTALFQQTFGSGACHNGPYFSDLQFHAIPTPQAGLGKNGCGIDYGRFNVTLADGDRHRLGRAPVAVWTPELVAALSAALDPRREGDSDVPGAAATTLAAVPEALWTPELVAALAAAHDPRRAEDWTRPELPVAVPEPLQARPCWPDRQCGWR